MPGTLYVVATPIGNLEDVTLRALRILREVALIAAEDTRRTARLLQHYSISTPTTSLHEHNERRKSAALIARLIAGESIALVSDAGTPVVSDPGSGLVAAAHAAAVRVEPVPGPNAAIAALSASGFEASEFLFLGFPPARSNARRRWIAEIATEPRVLILYEAPHRIQQTLQDLFSVLGDRTVAIGREITKAHEELVVRPISAHLHSPALGRGEYTLVISPPERTVVGREMPQPLVLASEFNHLTKNGSLNRRAAIKALAQKYAVSPRQVYAAVHRDTNSGI